MAADTADLVAVATVLRCSSHFAERVSTVVGLAVQWSVCGTQELSSEKTVE